MTPKNLPMCFPMTASCHKESSYSFFRTTSESCPGLANDPLVSAGDSRFIDCGIPNTIVSRKLFVLLHSENYGVRVE